MKEIDHPGDVPPDFYEAANAAIFAELDNLITVSVNGHGDEFLTFNIRKTRYELLKTIRKLAGQTQPSQEEVEANRNQETTAADKLPPQTVQTWTVEYEAWREGKLYRTGSMDIQAASSDEAIAGVEEIMRDLIPDLLAEASIILTGAVAKVKKNNPGAQE